MRHYLSAVLATAVVVLVRLALGGVLADAAPMLLFVVAVLAASWYGGLKPGLLATGLGAGAGGYLFLHLAQSSDQLHLALFVAVGVLASGVSGARHRHRRQVEVTGDYADSIVDTVGEPLIVLDGDLRVVRVNRSFSRTFKVKPEETENRLLYELGDGQWDIPKLRTLLEEILPRQTEVRDYEVEHDFPGVGLRIMRLNARRLYREGNGVTLFLLAVQDITDQERAERESRRREGFIGGVLGSITDGFGVVCKDWRFTFANDELVRRFGRRRDEVLGNALWELLPDAVGNHAYVQLHRAMAERVAVEYEVYYEPWQRWYLDKAFPTADGGLAVYTRDITDRKRAEGERTLLASIVENSSDFIGISDAEGNPLYGNRAAMRLVGVEGIGQVRRSKIVDYFVPEQRQFVAEVVLPAVMADGRWCGELLMRHFVTGAAIPVLYDLFRVDDPATGKPTNIATITRDLTGQKKAEAEREGTQKTLAAVVERCPFGIFIVDDEFRITDMNDGSRRGAFANVRPVIGRPLDEAMRVLWPEPVAAGVINTFRHTLATGEPYHSRDFVNPRADIGQTEGYEWELHRVTLPSGRHGVVCYFYDSTDLRRAEERLRASEDRLRLVVESATGFAIFTMTTGGVIDGWNAGAARLFGYAEAEAVGQHDRLLYTPEDAADKIPEREMDRAAAEGRAVNERWHAKKGGGRFWGSGLVQPLRKGGAVVGFLKIMRDMTQEREAEERLRASEARNSYLVVLADALRPLSDPATVQAEASRVLGERLGANRVAYFEVRGDDYAVERDYTDAAPSIAGRHPVASFGTDLFSTLRAGRIVTEADVDAPASRTPGERAAFAGIQTRAYICVPLVKGGAFVAGLAVYADRVRAWTPTEVAMTEDTAERTWAAVERVRAEAALRESEERRRMALDVAELGTWNFDPASGVVQTDARYRTIFGTTEECPHSLQLFAIIHPDDVSAVQEAMAAATRLEDPAPCAIEYRVVHPDGSHRWVSGKGRSGFEGTGPTRRVVSFDGTVADITDRKRAEEERERLVGQLRDADRKKDEFLATLAHELRNPLAPILNGLQVLRMAGANGAVEKARSMMDRQLTQLVRLVDDLLDVSRVTSGKLELRRGRVELGTVIDAAVETSRPAIEQAGHELAVAVPGGPVWLDADAIRLAQVVSNLLNNSAKYTHRGGHIRLTVGHEGETAVVSVKDDGIGIPPAMLDRVFQMFTQVDSTLEKTTGGLGIGLSLVRAMVEMHGGTVEARSDGEGRGSEFVVRLPALAVAGDAGRRDGPPEEVVTPGLRRILVVDDNADAADSLAQLLELLGNEVRTAYDGEAGVRAASEFRPAVVLCDIGMPRVNGYDAARRIRAEAWGRGMVLVALTGWGQEGDRRKSAEAGFDFHLVKPVEFAALMTLLAKLPIGTA